MSISNINTVHWFPIFVKYSISSNELYVYMCITMQVMITFGIPCSP